MKKDIELFIVATERDSDCPFKSDGAIVMETYTKSATFEEAVARAEQVDGRYGKAYVFRCTLVGTAEEARAVHLYIGQNF